MPLTARAYLLDRFRTDALVLRQRADTLAATARGTVGRGGGRAAAPVPGPDADTSRRMAAACDIVVEMLEAIPEADDPARALESIVSLLPLLEHRAAQEAGGAPVRAVYVGAATRIREVEAAEERAQRAAASEVGLNAPVQPAHEVDDMDDGELTGDDEFDDDDTSDDDDVDDDELHEDASR